MSWDIIAVNFPVEIPKEQVMSDKLPDFGNFEELREKIDQILPGIKWGYKDYPHLDNGLYRGHFGIDIENGICKDFCFHVYGGEDPSAVITKLCNTFKWQAFDLTTGQYMDLTEPDDEGWNKFQFSREEIRKAVEENPKLLNVFKKNKKWWEFWK